MRLSRAAVPLLREAGGGAIVNISAADGLEPTLMFPIGGSMRAPLSALTKLLARRLGGDRCFAAASAPTRAASRPTGTGPCGTPGA